jgi:hypothetical protein
MAVGDIFETVWRWTVGGESLVNVVHYRNTVYDGSSNGPALCVKVLQAIETVMISDWKPIGSVNVTLVGLDAFIVNEPTSSGTEPASVSGDVVGELAPLRSSPVAKKSSALRGRSYRGRMFTPPIPELHQAGGVIVGINRTNLDDWLEEIRIVDDGAGNTFRMTIYSPTLSNPATPLFVDTVVQTIIVQLNLGSIRKRQDVS